MHPASGNPFRLPVALVPWVRLALAVVAFNLPFWVLGRWFFIDRALFNLDMLPALLLAPFSPVLALAAVALAWMLDAAVGQSMTYHFTSPIDFLRSAAFANTLDWEPFLLSSKSLVVVPFVVCAAILWRLLRRPIGWRLSLVVFFVVAALDAVNGASLLAWRDTRWTVNFAGSPTAALLHQASRPAEARVLRPLPRSDGDVVREELLGWADRHPQGSVLVVVVESLGQHTHEAMRRWLRSQLWQGPLTARFDLREGRSAFKGATTAGELRVLCGLSGSYRAMSPQAGAVCLPHRFVERGWRTIGLHGFSSRMFERKAWWPMLGLQDIAFAEELLQDAPRCGAALRGLCDQALIRRAMSEAQTPRRFVYALTLNTHLPIEDAPLPDDLAALCAEVGAQDEVCQLHAQLGRVLAHLRDELAAAEHPLAVVVVGDHAPPFNDRRSRAEYEREWVPSFLLLPQRASQCPDSPTASACASAPSRPS
jgi:hypothetical protein